MQNYLQFTFLLLIDFNFCTSASIFLTFNQSQYILGKVHILIWFAECTEIFPKSKKNLNGLGFWPEIDNFSLSAAIALSLST